MDETNEDITEGVQDEPSPEVEPIVDVLDEPIVTAQDETIPLEEISASPEPRLSLTNDPITLPEVIEKIPSLVNEILQTPIFKAATPVNTSPHRSTSPAKGSVRTSIRSGSNPIAERLSLQKKTATRGSGLVVDAVSALEPQGKSISDHVDALNASVKQLSMTCSPESPVDSNLDKIAKMSKILTNEANALRQSIKSLADDIVRTKHELCTAKEDVNFPYHLFLIELVVNKINMKCECFDLDYNNLVISASFLGKQPIVLYDSSYGKIESFSKLNVGKSTMFAMTYDKICCIQEFEIHLQLTKQPPCSTCITKIAETHMDYTSEFMSLREELCKKWNEEKPNDNIICTTSTPLSKSLFYLTCGGKEPETIGVIEISVRLSFLGKEITTAFSACPKRGTSEVTKEDNGITMYSCQRVEMDDQGKILLDEDVLSQKQQPLSARPYMDRGSPSSQYSNMPIAKRNPYEHHNPYSNYQGDIPKYDEIFTKMNDNELKIRVPKSTKAERNPRYEKMQELCICEDTPYNTAEQIQFEMPKDLCNSDKTHNKYTSNLKYTYNGCDRSCESKKDRKVINVSPSNCPIPVDMEKVVNSRRDVFILKIGKKLETKDKKTDLEIELVTPKVQQDKPIENDISQQCSTTKMKKGAGKKKDKGKKKNKGKKKSKTSLKGGKKKGKK